MKRRFVVALFISLASLIIIHAFCLYRPFWQPFERRLYDLKYQATLSHMRQDRIVIVDIDERSLTKLGRFQNWPRAYFARAIEYLRNARVVGLDIFFGEPDTLPTHAQEYFKKPNFDTLLSAALKRSNNVVMVASAERDPIFTQYNRIGLGLVFADDDGIVRRGFFTLFNDTTFAAQVALMTGVTVRERGYLIHYVDEKSFRRISFSDVYLRRVPEEYFDDKIVLIGGTAEGLFDYHAVPFDRHFPGVVIQANLINNFINSMKIIEISYIIVIILIFTLSIVFSYFLLTRSTITYGVLCSVLYSIFIISSFFLFSSNIHMGVVRPTYTLLLVTVISLIYRYQFAEREKRQLKHIFSRYYSRELVEKVTEHPPKLGGEKVVCTVLFADIRNFTPYVEKTDPESVGEKLNLFLDEMVKSIFAYQGRVDKFIGDCVMAVFGSPVPVKNHALNACLAALDMVEKAQRLGFKIGVGINSGEVISGNFGSPMRMEYTVIGDTVNLASRLEGVTKDFNCPIVISEMTFRQIRQVTEQLKLAELGRIKVKGKEEEITVHSLQRLPGQQDSIQ